MDATKRCPYCAEEIRSEALRCRYCRSRLTTFASDQWHRDHPEARFAGVCAAVAHAFDVPVAAVRIATVILAAFKLFGVLLYGVLYLVIPPRPGADSLAERGMQWLLATAKRWGGPANGGTVPPDKSS